MWAMIEKLRMWLSAVTDTVQSGAEPDWIDKAAEFSVPDG